MTTIKTKSKIKSPKNINKGFTLFVAVVLSTLLLSIGLSLSNILLKQLVFSNTGRESQIAFYAADSGAECALYWDRKNADGSTSIDGAFSTSSTPQIYCGSGNHGDATVGGLEKVLEAGANPSMATTTFFIDYTIPAQDNDPERKACAKVTVSKSFSVLQVGSQIVPIQRTVIDSRGYNAPYVGTYGSTTIAQDDGCDVSKNIRAIERAVRLNY